MFNAIQYIYNNLFAPIIFAILDATNTLVGSNFDNDNLFAQPLTITLFSDTPIVVTNLYDISLVVLNILFTIWFSKFIVYILKVPFKFFKGLGR